VGATGSIQFSNGFGSFNADSANLFWKESNNRLGIGTNNPGASLDVAGTVTSLSSGNTTATVYIGRGVGSGAALLEIGSARTLNGNSFIDFWSASSANGTVDYNARLIRSTGLNGDFALSNRGTGTLKIRQEEAGDIELITNNSVRMTIEKTTGDVGIGTSNPSEKLVVNGAIKIGTTANNNAGTIRWDGTDFQGRITGAWKSLTRNSDGVAGAIQYSDGSGDFSSEAINLFYDDSTNRLGIGMNTPSERLEVDGNIKTLGGTSHIGFNRTGASESAQLTIGNNIFNGIALLSLGKNRTGSGNTYIDLTSSPTTAADYDSRMIRWSGENGSLDIRNTGSGAIKIYSEDAGHIKFLTDSVERMIIEHTSGDIGIGTSNPTERLHVVGNTKLDGESIFKADSFNMALTNIAALPTTGKMFINLSLSGGVSSLNGMTDGLDGRMVIIHNASGNNLLVNDNNAAALVQNRIKTSTQSQVVIAPRHAGFFMYDGSVNKWRLLFVT